MYTQRFGEALHKFSLVMKPLIFFNIFPKEDTLSSKI